MGGVGATQEMVMLSRQQVTDLKCALFLKETKLKAEKVPSASCNYPLERWTESCECEFIGENQVSKKGMLLYPFHSNNSFFILCQ